MHIVNYGQHTSAYSNSNMRKTNDLVELIRLRKEINLHIVIDCAMILTIIPTIIQ